MIDPPRTWHCVFMTPHVQDFCVLWLRGVIAGAVGLSLGACAVADPDDLAGETSTEGEMQMPNDPVACSEMEIVVEGPVLPDGTCGPCDEACQEAADMLAQSSSSECGDTCACSAVSMCSPTMPDENGLCLHGFYSGTCGGGTEGRPLLVGEEIRVAPACARADWSDATPQLDVPAVLRERVLAGWLERAAMEHASIAAFARFTLQLLELGASAELIDAAQVAGRDEARHARLCYGVTSQLGASVGPDRLDLRGLVLDVDPARVVFESIVEGCIGETIAAAKMRYLAARVENREIAAMLETIAQDEATHAALAWKALDWMLRNFDVHAVARETFAAAIQQGSGSQTRPHESAMVRYGVLDEATGAWLADEVLHSVIAPAAAGLLGTRCAA